MESLRKNRSLWIDQEAIATLKLVKEGVLYPVTQLMDSNEAKEVDETGLYKGTTFPFSLILAPSGVRNEKTLKEAVVGEIIDLRVNGELVGNIKVKEIFKIDKFDRVEKIFGTRDKSHPGVKDTIKRLGNYAIAGEYDVKLGEITKIKNQIQEAKKAIGAKRVTAMMMAAKPLHRSHERLIRGCTESNDLVVIFLLKPYKHDFLNYNLRYKTVEYFVGNFLPKGKVLIIPFENTYIFAGLNNVILDSIAAKNFGCDQIVIGQNHSGIGHFYDADSARTISDSFKNVNIDVKVVSEYVYCNQCKTLVSENTCPHGKHHHISYHSESILELLRNGIIPPAVLIRKEISAMLLSELFPHRFNNLFKLFADLVPNSGFLENHDDKEFYEELLNLYQTTSLT